MLKLKVLKFSGFEVLPAYSFSVCSFLLTVFLFGCGQKDKQDNSKSIQELLVKPSVDSLQFNSLANQLDSSNTKIDNDSLAKSHSDTLHKKKQERKITKPATETEEGIEAKKIWKASDFQIQLQKLAPAYRINSTVLFDFNASVIPFELRDKFFLAFDALGDGQWDATTSFAPAIRMTHVYKQVGLIKSKFRIFSEGIFDTTLTVSLQIADLPKLSITLPDTVEPGKTLQFNLKAVAGGQSEKPKGSQVEKTELRLWLDIDGDGTWDLETKPLASVNREWMAPKSGQYNLIAIVRDSLNWADSVRIPYVSNSRVLLKFEADVHKIHLAQEVKIHARVWDKDDALDSVCFSNTLDGLKECRADLSLKAGKFEQSFSKKSNKPGHYVAKLCAYSADKRTRCEEIKIEAYNAEPECLAGEKLSAIQGQPIVVRGDGRDVDGNIRRWEWDFDDDGKYEIVSEKSGTLKYTFTKIGRYDLHLKVTSDDGRSVLCTKQVEVSKK